MRLFLRSITFNVGHGYRLRNDKRTGRGRGGGKLLHLVNKLQDIEE